MTRKEEALKRYYDSPNTCLCCKSIIDVKSHEKISNVRQKKFCNSACSASFNNQNRHQNHAYQETIRLRKLKKTQNQYDKCKCGQAKKKTANNCKNYYESGLRAIEKTTKGHLIKAGKNWWESRIPIAKNARKVYSDSGKPKCCYNCGYSKTFQVCHIKAVSEFPEGALVGEINHIDNLVALCPNCHWEFDNGQLSIDVREQALVG